MDYNIDTLSICEHCYRHVNVRKNQIIKEYLNLGIKDLLDTTRSCEGEFEGLNYKNYIPYQEVPVCGNCFWCKERE